MSHQVKWTSRTTNFFLDNCIGITEFDRNVLLTRISGMTVLQQSFYFSCSKSTVERSIRKLKMLYDEVQREYPDELRPRVSSQSELYQDNH